MTRDVIVGIVCFIAGWWLRGRVEDFALGLAEGRKNREEESEE